MAQLHIFVLNTRFRFTQNADLSFINIKNKIHNIFNKPTLSIFIKTFSITFDEFFFKNIIWVMKKKNINVKKIMEFQSFKKNFKC